MSIKRLLKNIEDELDSIQCVVTLTPKADGVEIIAKNEIDRLLAAKACKDAGFVVAISLVNRRLKHVRD